MTDETADTPTLADSLRAAWDEQAGDEPESTPEVQQAESTETPETTETAETVTEEAAPENVLEAPQNWPAERRELFSKLDDATKEMVLGMSKDMEGGLTRKTQELAEQRKRYEGFDSLMDSQSALFGVGKEQFVGALTKALPELLSTYAKLQRDPVGTIRQLADLYNVSDKLSETLLSQDNDENARAKRLRDAELENENRRLKDEQTRAAQSRANELVNSFRNEKNENGSLKHEYFDELQPEMARLIQADPSLDLERAYQKALRSEKFDALLKAELAKERENIEAERRKKAASARKATKPTIGKSNGSGVTAPKVRSLRDEIAAGYDEQLNRQ